MTSRCLGHDAHPDMGSGRTKLPRMATGARATADRTTRGGGVPRGFSMMVVNGYTV